MIDGESEGAVFSEINISKKNKIEP